MKEHKKRIKGKKQGKHAKLDVLNKINTTLRKNTIQKSERIFALNMDSFLDAEIEDELEIINNCIHSLGFWGRLVFLFKGMEF